MSAWLLYGQRSDGELLHISEALRGEVCHCFCPHCQTPLAAKKGKVKVHHFAHLGKTCAHVSAYDFLHIESVVDTSLSLSEWASWKQNDIVATGKRLAQQLPIYEQDMARLLADLEPARKRLELISQPHPSRKQRSQKRQANYEILQQWDHWLEDHNADELDLDRVRDLDSCEYVLLNYRKINLYDYGYSIGRSAWPNELWWEENANEEWVPYWLAKAGIRLLNEYHPLRRKLMTTKQHLEAFVAEKARFDRFRLYWLHIEFEHRPPLFKVGITSRTDLTERIAEIRQDLRRAGVSSIAILNELPGYAFLESFFKKKYNQQQVKLGTLTEYFNFDDQQFAEIQSELNRLVALHKQENAAQKKKVTNERISQGMAQARSRGIHVGRPSGQETAKTFLAKDTSQRILALINQHPDWSMRAVAKQAGMAINTVCKVNNLYKKTLNSPKHIG